MTIRAVQTGDNQYDVVWTGPDGATRTYPVSRAYPEFTGKQNEITSVQIDDGLWDTVLTIGTDGSLVLTSGNGRVVRGAAAEQALQSMNNDSISLDAHLDAIDAAQAARVEAGRADEAARAEAARRAGIERNAAAYEPGINPFITRVGALTEGGESVRVDTAEGSVQIVAKSDTGLITDRDAAYRVDRRPDGVLVETFMQYGGLNGGITTRNFYELHTSADGVQTAWLHTFNLDGTYTKAEAPITAALENREQNLTVIGSDMTLIGGVARPHFLNTGILEEAVRGLQQSGSTLENVVFGDAVVPPAHRFTREALGEITERGK